MGFIYSDSELVPLLYAYAGDILGSEGMQCEKKYKQHGDVSCYGHSIAVACESARLALRLRLRGRYERHDTRSPAARLFPV